MLIRLIIVDLETLLRAPSPRHLANQQALDQATICSTAPIGFLGFGIDQSAQTTTCLDAFGAHIYGPAHAVRKGASALVENAANPYICCDRSCLCIYGDWKSAAQLPWPWTPACYKYRVHAAA